MDPHPSHPLDRMKPQRGRRPDLPAPVMAVPASEVRHRRWRLVAFAIVASSAAAAICVVAAQSF